MSILAMRYLDKILTRVQHEDNREDRERTFVGEGGEGKRKAR